MFRPAMIACPCLLVALAGCAKSVDSDPGAGSLGVGGAKPDADRPVTLEPCPPEVQDTIASRLDGGDTTELERTTDHGEVLFEADVVTAHGIVEFDVAEDGTFRGYEEEGDDDDRDDDEGEEEIPLDEVPDHVKLAAEEAVPGIVLEEAERETEDGVVIYDLDGEADGVEYEVEVNEDGEILDVEQDDDEEDDD